ncbi:unnamed protein product [Rhizopus stolonifer]
MADANPLQFSDPKVVPESALFSFHPLFYLYFILSFLLVPYPLYRWIASKYKWELNSKSIARHCSDLLLGMSYGLILFTFGNYTHAFSWITVVAFYPSLFGYGLIAELPYTKTSLPNIKQWPKGMWVVFLIALGVILAFAAFHIYLASQLPFPFIVYYVCALLIPIFFLVLSFLLKREVNENWIRTSLARPKKNADGEEANYGASENNKEIPHNPYSNTVSIHIHHWQIFYVLAFFTRFTHPASQVAAGIVLACYMQGICACK